MQEKTMQEKTMQEKTMQEKTISPDGLWLWNGSEWVPNPANPMTGSVAPQPPVAGKRAKKRLGLKVTGGILAALVVIGIATSGGEDAGTTSEQPQDVAAAPADEQAAPAEEQAAPADEKGAADEAQADQPAVPAIGDQVRDGKFEFTVTGVKTGVSSVGGAWGEEAQGAFTLVTVTVENIGDEAQMFDASNMKGTDSKGREVESDSMASNYASDDDVFLEDINPGNSIEAVIAFDLAKGVKLQTVELHDSMFSNGVEVALKK